ncbi:hypothetical protein B5X24_HaOG211445 [Helicoverpa armigera]|nr:hypothetical protein B5X24_HaOG211445 [Helicoverpa armigera]
MRDLVAAHFANAPAPQAPARNPSPPHAPAPSLPSSLETYNSHRKIKRPMLGGRQVYRPVRRHTLSRIDEAPGATRPRSKSLQHSADFSSTRPILRSRSNISADTSRSVPVCNQSQDVQPQVEGPSPQYAEPERSDSSSYERPASMTDLPIMVPLDPATGAYIPYPEYTYYRDDGCRLARYRQYNKSRKYSSKHSNLYLAFMY